MIEGFQTVLAVSDEERRDLFVGAAAHLRTNETGRKATGDAAMAEDCVCHARMFFNRPDLDLASAVPGSFALTPHDGMLADLRRDYEAMSGMVFGPVSTVDAVVTAIVQLEQRINRRH
jgi:hypothetical protein